MGSTLDSALRDWRVSAPLAGPDPDDDGATGGASMLAILTRAAAAVLSPVLREAEARLVEPGEGAGALAAAARIPADPLLLDVATGPGLGPAVLRYRLARPQTRVVLLAPGRSPGDAEVAGVVQAGVYDVVTDPADLAAALAGPPGDLAAGARWLDPDLSPGGTPAVPARERVVGRRVAVGTHPVTILVAGLGSGVGTTTLACALAGYTARLGHETALVGIGEYGALGLTEPGRWVPHLDAFPCAAGAGDVVRARRYPYVVVDAGVAPPGDPPGGGDERAEGGAEARAAERSSAEPSGAPQSGAPPRRPSALPEVGVDPDVVVLVCPAAVWRYRVVRDWLRRWPFATPLPGRVVLNGVDHCTREEVTDLIAGTCAERRVQVGPLDTFPVLREPGTLPPGYRQADAEVDGAVGRILGAVVPEHRSRRRLLW